MSSARIAVGDVTPAQPEELFSPEGSKRISADDPLAHLLAVLTRIAREGLTKLLPLASVNSGGGDRVGCNGLRSE